MKTILSLSLLAFFSCKKCHHCTITKNKKSKFTSNGVYSTIESTKTSGEYCGSQYRSLPENGSSEFIDGYYWETEVNCN